MKPNDTATLIKMIDTLPESTQPQVIEHLREYITELHEEMKWAESYKKTSGKLEKYAKKVKKEISEGKSKPMDFSKL